ncbi:MurR/RpiR family transcriptional regulator [Pseudonocardia sp. TRM90224]|uniref:MurR/RpiR family transcriptional regulator n=1 Tax=Pseudonocardia sp. TRM90224 TaxID=2812678 RepID=UPI001E4EE295|nr:MurR/RpiR family transcriptional regulator [Pseudonocardia sp. TRM90224]
MTTGSSGAVPFADRLGERKDQLSRSERRVAEYIEAHVEKVIFLSAVELAELTDTSDATVIRTARALGYSGLPELKHDLGAHLVLQTHPARRLATRIAMLRTDDSPGSLQRSVYGDAAERLTEAERILDEDVFAAAVELLAAAPDVVTYGVGVMRVVADYCMISMRRIGLRARLAGQMGFGLADELLLLREHDVVVLFAPGRIVRDVEVIVEHARTVGAHVVLVTDSLRQFDDQVDVVLVAQTSSTGLTGDPLNAMVMTDALALALAQRDEGKAAAHSTVLTRLRKLLVGRRVR